MVWLERMQTQKRQEDDARSETDVDYARLIHSASFRRLQGKTQIYNLGDSDFYRTRLTHSLEVAQIAGGLVKQLQKLYPDHPANQWLPDRSLIQTIGSAHDLGHPPFGHGGEVALNYCMRDGEDGGKGGFEGNGQTLRILSRLENFSRAHGANLTRRSLLGILKYPVAYSRAANPAIKPALKQGPSTLRIIDTELSKPPKCYLDSEADIVAWILDPLSAPERDAFEAFDVREGKHARPLHKSFDCSIMDVSDDIAYGVHDLEDAIALKLVTPEDFSRLVLEKNCNEFLEVLKRKYPEKTRNDAYGQLQDELFGPSERRKLYISMLVSYFMSGVEYEERTEFADPLIRYRVRMKDDRRRLIEALKTLVFDKVIWSPSIQHFEFKGQGMVVAVFEALQSDPKRLMPEEAYRKLETAGGDLRILCDFVSGMTDTYLMKTYERLFSPRMGSVFDRL